MGILEKIAEVEREIARTQKNKGMCVEMIVDEKFTYSFNMNFVVDLTFV